MCVAAGTNCRKLGNGANYREIQPLNGRTIYMYTSATPCPRTQWYLQKLMNVARTNTPTIGQYRALKDQGMACTSAAAGNAPGLLSGLSILLLTMLLFLTT